jgi:hypothetical protein
MLQNYNLKKSYVHGGFIYLGMTSHLLYHLRVEQMEQASLHCLQIREILFM